MSGRAAKLLRKSARMRNIGSRSQLTKLKQWFYSLTQADRINFRINVNVGYAEWKKGATA